MTATTPQGRKDSGRRVRRRATWGMVGERVGRAVLVVLIATGAVVVLLALTPGTAAEAILGENATPEAVAALNAELGYDRPLWEQYFSWLGNAVTGDLGVSPINGEPVTDAILARLPVTLEIAVLGLLIGLVVSVFLAIVSATTEGSALDRAISGLSSVLLSVPAFVAGPVLIYLLAVQTGAFPVSGWNHIEDGLGPNLASAFLPALAIALNEIAAFHRLLRADLIGTLREDFIAAARAKGMSRGYVMFRHALRPSSFSLITVMGINLGRLIGGTVVVEVLFGLPGLGQLVATAITERDAITVQGIVVFIAVVYVAVNTLVDLSYGFLDPRVRKAGRS
ncbi:peptide/nickel transport system permease protein [Prauserella sediminis]|uniref:Peptide/nickel transport system permease protein n=1 Tax=Prauserella sediminis TaxID=577680 RepID=A0A839XSB2_9PSEU|nr:ABC transporter permease [Prauserella sediminis]MBB3665621.1 peptide/nickel transport system permease protein [Prauserella sediminis]